jgi:hypothetical protein
MAHLRGDVASGRRAREEVAVAIHGGEPLDVVVCWVEAMRSGDLDEVAAGAQAPQWA